MSNINQPPQPPYQLPPAGGQPQQYPPQQPAKPQKTKRFGWPTVVIVAVGSWFIGLMFGIAGEPATTTTAAPAPTVTVTATGTTAAEPSSSTLPAPKKTTPPKPAATMDEGTYEIGVDAPAGRYKTVAEDSCYWKRSKDDSGTLDSILANDNVNDGARASVTVKKGEFFTSEGCGTWTKT